MAEERIDLETAGRLLGVGANAVRARAKKDQIRWERDNTGKIWVWLDREKAANDRALKPSKPPVEPSNEGLNEPLKAPEINALKVAIEALNEELRTVRGERDALRERAGAADRLEAEKSGLAAQLEALEKSAALAGQAASETIADLRGRLDRLTDENRDTLQKLVEAMADAVRRDEERALAVAQAAQERRRGLFGWFGARKA